MTVKILIGDCRDKLRELPDGSVNCCVTSPPYFGLRDYGCDGQMGLEPTPDEFVAGMVDVFREVRRVLRDDGTLWLNIGDSYNAAGRVGHGTRIGQKQMSNRASAAGADDRRTSVEWLKPKDLIGIPWMLAFALRADGWHLRQEIIWHKPNPMPESIRDRCTKAHEQIFLLSKKPHYYFDADAIKEEATCGRLRGSGPMVNAGTGRQDASSGTVGDYRTRPSKKRGEFNGKTNAMPGREAFRAITDMRNKRSVWSVSPKSFKEAHFATFPPALIEPCILAGCPVGGTVLDPFYGAGTTGLVADQFQRNCIGIELNSDYAEIARKRLLPKSWEHDL